MLNFFSRTAGLHADDGAVYRFREPSLDTPPRRPAERSRGAQRAQTAPAVLPTNYGDIVAFFRRTVAERRSPYNQLCRAAEHLKDYIPDEMSRMKVAWSMLREQISPEALALAINTHLADIDLARQKAGKYTPEMAAAESARLQRELAEGRQRRDALQAEVEGLRQRLAEREKLLEAENAQLDNMQRDLESLQSSANSAGFLDQAAENEKNDLLARKVLLGLN